MKLGVLGSTGRMGRLVVQKILETPSFQLAALGVRNIPENKPSREGVMMTSQLKEIFSSSDVVIDFTKPEALEAHLKQALASKIPMVIGTTGLTEHHKSLLQEAGASLPLVYDVNMSLGLTLLLQLVEQAAALLGENFDIEVLEMHHRAKMDAPSGTGLALGKAAAQGRKIPFDPHACFDRVTRLSSRPAQEIGFSVLRGGNVPGDHQVIFASDEEMITLSHRALHRDVFAKGALKAALWVKDKKPGLYSMKDVLGL